MQRTACLLALFAVTIVPPPLGAAEVGFDPPITRTDDIECADRTFVIELVTVGEVTGVQGFSIAFEFDAELLRPVTVRPGDVLTDQEAPFFFFPWQERFAEGLVQIDAAVLGTTCDVPSPEGGTVLAAIEFEKLGCADASPCGTALDLVLIDVRNNQNHGITVGSVDGAVNILPCSLPVEESSWGRIKASYQR